MRYNPPSTRRTHRWSLLTCSSLNPTAQDQAKQLTAPRNETQNQLMIPGLLHTTMDMLLYLRYEFSYPNPNHITATLSPCD
jgi:hypothetical protein